jgi:hypothetical protein
MSVPSGEGHSKEEYDHWSLNKKPQSVAWPQLEGADAGTPVQHVMTPVQDVMTPVQDVITCDHKHG